MTKPKLQVAAALVNKFPKEVNALHCAYISERFETAKPTGEGSEGFKEGADWARGSNGDLVFFVDSKTMTSELRDTLGVWTGVSHPASTTPPAYHTCDRPSNDALRNIFLSNTPEEERKDKLMQMNNDALRRILRDAKLKVSGNKSDLVERIFDSLKERHGESTSHPYYQSPPPQPQQPPQQPQQQPQQPQQPQQQREGQDPRTRSYRNMIR